MGNVALNKTASSNMSVAPFTPDKAFTGVASAIDRWVGTVPGWLCVDLGYPYWINQWTIKNEAVISGWENNIMKDYRLQASNDTKQWSDISVITGNTSSTTQVPINPTRSRYFRTYITNGLRVNSGVASILDMELEEYSNPPYLSNLVVSSGTLSPVFYKQNFNYTVNVAQEVTEMYVIPTTTASNATITVNGKTVTNATQSQYITLNEGTTIISVVVAITNTTLNETYTISVTKNASPYLENIIVNGAILSEMFSPDVTSYLAYLDEDVTEVTVTPYAQTANALVSVNNMTVISGQTSNKINTGTDGMVISLYVENTSPKITYQIELQ